MLLATVESSPGTECEGKKSLYGDFLGAVADIPEVQGYLRIFVSNAASYRLGFLHEATFHFLINTSSGSDVIIEGKSDFPARGGLLVRLVTHTAPKWAFKRPHKAVQSARQIFGSKFAHSFISLNAKGREGSNT